MPLPEVPLDGFYVYTYNNPLKDYHPFYVGKGCGRRAFDHLYENKSNNPHKYRTIQKIRSAGLEPTINIIPVGSSEEVAFLVERGLIKHWGRSCDGGILTNITLGGEGSTGYHHSEEHKHRMSELQTGSTRSEETRRKMSQNHNAARSNPGYPKTEETRSKISCSHQGMKHSLETRRKISEGQRGQKRKPRSAETRQKIANALTGKKQPKISAAKLGHEVSQETRFKLSLAHKGKKQSEETCRKKSEAGKRRYSRRTLLEVPPQSHSDSDSERNS